MGGVKYDDGKLPWYLLPMDAVAEVVRVLQFGMKKYGDRNWESGMNYSRLYSAALRHLTAWFQHGEDNDPETGINHLAHAACCILFLLAYAVRGMVKWDDRPNIVKESVSIFGDKELLGRFNSNHPSLLGTTVTYTMTEGGSKRTGTICKVPKSFLNYADDLEKDSLVIGVPSNNGLEACEEKGFDWGIEAMEYIK